MKIKDGFELRDVCGEHIIVSHGDNNIDFSKVIHLNESSALMWQAIEGKEFTVEDMADALIQNYEVDCKEALADAADILDKWKQLEMVEQ